MASIGEAIKHFRTNGPDKITQTQLGVAIGIKNKSTAQTKIKLFENGTNNPSEEEISKIFKQLNVSKDDLEEYLSKESSRLVINGEVINDEILKIWPDAIKYFRFYAKACEEDLPEMKIATLKQMVESLQKRVGDYEELHEEGQKELKKK